ncbi:MAG: hypothetical protein QNK31_05640 [Porticoccus sp.]|nr:hypothetical protein [Porticoccus sp.]
MEPISSINLFPLSGLSVQARWRVASTPQTAQDLNVSGVDQVRIHSENATLLNKLPQEPINNVNSILQQINTHALQSLELGQTFENRQLLQADVSEDISSLRTILDELSQDDLTLLVALFQNQPLVGADSFNTGQSNSDFFNTDQDIFNASLLSNGVFENLFRIDVTSETGSLIALDITGNVLDILSSRNFGSRLLESLLESLTNTSLNTEEGDVSEQNQDDTTGQLSSNEYDWNWFIK